MVPCISRRDSLNGWGAATNRPIESITKIIITMQDKCTDWHPIIDVCTQQTASIRWLLSLGSTWTNWAALRRSSDAGLFELTSSNTSKQEAAMPTTEYLVIIINVRFLVPSKWVAAATADADLFIAMNWQWSEHCCCAPDMQIVGRCS